jgi:hypothetical protein
MVFFFLKRLPGDRCKSALKKGVPYNILLVIFAFDDPITGMNLALSRIGNERGRLFTLGRLYQ